MKQRNQFGKILLLLCVLMIAALGCLEVSADTTETQTITSNAEATGACTNVSTEGIQYYYPITVPSADSDRWRSELSVSSTTGSVSSLQLDVIGSTAHYQCTEITPSVSTGAAMTFSCNTLPAGSTIKGVWFYYKPNNTTAGTDFTVTIQEVSGDQKILNIVNAEVTLPPYPCSRNSGNKDLLAYTNQPLIINTSDSCSGEHKSITFYEDEDNPYAFVNMIDGALETGRFKFEVSPAVTYSYTMTFTFEDVNKNQYTLGYTYNPNNTDPITVNADSNLSSITQASLPLTLVSGTMDNISTTKKDLWGNDDYPTSTAFTIQMYYANTNGTIGYENSSFHFTRYLDIQFAPYCTATSGTTRTGVASSDYDSCKSTRQMFMDINLQDSAGNGIVPSMTIPTTRPTDVSYYYFATRKCVDSSCNSIANTTAYPYSIRVSDGESMVSSYVASYVNGYTVTAFAMRVWQTTNKPFAIKEITMMVDEPGTYVIYAFLGSYSQAINYTDPGAAAAKFYVTINDSESIANCSTLGNNGYFMAYWNDCLDYRLTQLLTFSQISGKETAWIENRSATGIHYTYSGENSYLPKKFELASLNCEWASVSGATGSVGYCGTTDIYIPAYTRVTVTGGTAYLESIPSDTDYTYETAFYREDTMSIMDLNIDVQVKACENVKKIPDTGISLRSPLKVKESVKEDTSYVFTGNSLQIPAIGLGMEYPAPIVHVYYEEGSEDLGWDLSTLGNYVGELEGGSYLPYAGNSVLTGHYYSQGVFKNLENLNPGDEIIILGNDGFKYTYRVTQKFYAEEDDVYEMFQQVGDRSLTLVTCDNYDFVTNEYSRRLLVRATIDHQEPYEMAAE